mgnify:CR=1 FL=1
MQSTIDRSFERLKTFDVKKVLPSLHLANEGAILDVLNQRAWGEYCLNYQWWPCFFDEVKPRQVVELGSAMGVAAICMLHSQYQDYKLFGITLEEGGIEFSYIEKGKYPNFTPVIGDDLDLSLWPKDLDLSATDIWYFDSLHSEEQLRKELELYKQFLKPGAIAVFDDIHINPGMNRVWHELEEIIPLSYKEDYGNPLHFTGYGIIQIKEKI